MDNLYLNHQEAAVPLMAGNNANDGTTLSADANMSVAEYRSFLAGRFGSGAGAVFAQYPANSTAQVQLQLAQIMENGDFIDSVKFAAGSMSDISPDTYMLPVLVHHSRAARGSIPWQRDSSCSSGSPG